MRRNGLNSVGMINDTKQKEIIDLIAEAKMKEVKPLLRKWMKMLKETSRTTHLRNTNQDTKTIQKYLPKKKMQTTSGSTKKDSYNKIYITTR